MWFELASHLGMSLQRCKRETSSTEFLDWIRYLEKKRIEDLECMSKQDYYLAQIAAQIHRTYSKKAKTIFDFILKIKKKKKMKASRTKEGLRVEKSRWFTAVGYKENK